MGDDRLCLRSVFVVDYKCNRRMLFQVSSADVPMLTD